MASKVKVSKHLRSIYRGTGMAKPVARLLAKMKKELDDLEEEQNELDYHINSGDYEGYDKETGKQVPEEESDEAYARSDELEERIELLKRRIKAYK